MASPLETLLLIALGRLFVYLWMEFPLPEKFDNSKFGKLHKCSLCSSVWIFSIIFILFRVDILYMLGLPSIFLAGNFISGGAISFLVHLLELGWKEKFNVMVIE